MKKNYCKIVLLLFFLSTFPLTAFAGSYTIYISEGGWVDSGQPDTIVSIPNPGLYVFNFGGVEHISYLKFDLSSINDKEFITSLKLYSRMGSLSQYDFPFYVDIYHVSEDDWQENTLTWNNQPGFKKLLGTGLFIDPSPFTVWDLSGYNYKPDTNDNILSLAMVIPDNPPIRTGVAFSSYWDYLEVESARPPVPEPSTMLLLGSGLIGLAGYGRKKFCKK